MRRRAHYSDEAMRRSPGQAVALAAAATAGARAAASFEWAPSYSLPAPGEIDIIATEWLDNALAPHSGSIPGTFNWEYSLFNSYGVGVLVEDYSPGGGFVWAGTGGHDHPDILGAIVFDFSDLTAVYLPHTNQGRQFSTYTNSYGLRDAESTGAPWHEVIDSVDGNEAVPRPGHPYQQMAPMPSALGGGSKGSIIYVGRAGIGEGGQLSAQRVHRFDLASARWSRISTATLARADTEGSVSYDAARGRYWHTCAGGNFAQSGYQDVEYLDATDWTVKYLSTGSSWPSSNIGQNAARSFVYGGLLFLQGLSNTLYAFDPDNNTAGWQAVNISGNLLSRYDRWCYYPPTGKFYTIGQDGGTLTRITPPSGNLISNAWTVDTVTLDASLPALTRSGDGSNNTQGHWGLLFYVPSIQRMAWIPDGSTICLLNPT